MAVRSTVGLDRDLLRRVDEWAAKTGRPTGPGHRKTAIEDLVRYALAAPMEDIDGPAAYVKARPTQATIPLGAGK
jgi:hypothetical protein